MYRINGKISTLTSSHATSHQNEHPGTTSPKTGSSSLPTSKSQTRRIGRLVSKSLTSLQSTRRRPLLASMIVLSCAKSMTRNVCNGCGNPVGAILDTTFDSAPRTTERMCNGKLGGTRNVYKSSSRSKNPASSPGLRIRQDDNRHGRTAFSWEDQVLGTHCWRRWRNWFSFG